MNVFSENLVNCLEKTWCQINYLKFASLFRKEKITNNLLWEIFFNSNFHESKTFYETLLRLICLVEILYALLNSHYEVRRKRSTERLKYTGNLFRKKLQLKGFC